MKILLSLFALVTAVMANDNNITDSLGILYKTANDRFTADMFQEVANIEGDKSFVISAFSVMSPLAQLALASVGESRDEILKAIRLPDNNITLDVFTGLNTGLRSIKEVVLTQANKLYISDGNSVNEQFAALSKRVFDLDVQNIDFGQNKEAVDEINAWVDDQTNKRIQNLLTYDSITPSTAAVLVNAIYFKGGWSHPFSEYDTQNKTFHVSNTKSITVPMMTQTHTLKYGESQELDAKFLEIEYRGYEASFVVALPNQIDGIKSMIAKTVEPTILNNVLNNMTTTMVEVFLPKFKIETSTSLAQVLKNMNVKKIFNPIESRLENLIKGSADVSITDAVQKAYINVDEEGTEAAASNVFIGLGGAWNPIEPKLFNADHPFQFFIMLKNNILFNGVYQS